MVITLKRKICYITTLSETVRDFFIPQIKYLEENGFDVSVITSPDDTLQDELGENIRFIPITIVRGISPMTIFGSIKSLVSVFRKEKFDIIQYSTPNAAFCAAIAGWLANVGTRNYHLMGLRYMGFDGVKRTMLKSLERLTCRLSTHIECITQSNLDVCIADRLFKPEKGTMIHNGSTCGVDFNRYDISKKQQWRNEIRAELGLDEDDFVFGFVGRITRDKGINELLRAFFGIKDKCKLCIVGNGEGLHTLDSKLWNRAENDENIVIHSKVKDIERYYCAMDVLILPSYREGFGMVIAEAAAMGVPTIISDIPGPIDVVSDGVTGFWVPLKDSDGLRRKMEEVLHDPTVCRAMADDCIENTKRKYDSAELFEKILERKRELLAEV